MFPGNFFAKTYFTPSYWAGTAAIAAGGCLLLALHGTGGAGNIPVAPEIIPSSGGGMYVPHLEKKQAKHVKLFGKTWQEQDTYGYAGIKYDLVSQHKVFALGKTGQEQVSVGSITSTNLVNVYKTDKLVSVHYQANAVTAQSQESSGTVSVSNFSIPLITDNSIETPNLVIGLQETSQVQQSVGSITTKQVSIGVSEVSTHYHHISIGAVHIVQAQVSSGSVSTSNNIVETHANNKVILLAATYQQQVSFGKVTTDDNEMLQVLLALMMLDDEVT